VPRAFTQLEIATRVGASREMVNHVLRDLVRGGFILKDKQHRMTIVKKLPRHW
jgi:CRP/FNR family cyclic AMP-dependent transcriptional regulator